MARLSTHVLDTAHGKPAAGVAVDLFRLQSGVRHQLASSTTNADGRPAEPLLSGERIEPGEYELIFGVAAYFRSLGMVLPSPPYLDQVVVRFGVADPHGHYHVPLLVSPYGYSTYRGS